VASLHAAEHLFVVWALLVFAGASTALLSYLGFSGQAGIGDAPRQILLPPIYLTSAGLLLLRPGGLLKVARRNTPTLMLTLLALVSWTWSQAPMLSAKRGVMLIGLTLFALYLVTRFNQRELLRLLGWALGIIAVLSVAAALLSPDRGIAGGIHAGAWTGIYSDKNALGRYMALAALVFMSLAMHPEGSRSAWLSVGVCAVLVVLSRSTTALVAMACALGMIGVMPLLRQRGLIFLSFVISLAVLLVNSALLILLNFGTATNVLGKDPSLTGRVPLWNVLVQNVWQKPLLGHGYNAFWTAEDGQPSALQFDVTGAWDVWHAHNGFLDLALELGLIGLVIFLIGYLVGFGRAVRTLRTSSYGAGFWQVAVLVFLLATNVGESMVMRYNGLWWVVYLVVVFAPSPLSPSGEQQSGERTARVIKAASVPTHLPKLSRPGRRRTLPSIRWRV
jgi:O-antigen ligase